LDIALRSADQLSRVSINKIQLSILGNLSEKSVRLIPSFIPIKSLISHITQYKFSSKHLQGLKVLDIACGTGYGSEILRLRGNTVLGVDINPDNIRIAKTNFPEVSFQFGDAENLLDFQNESFDAINSIQTIEHLGHPKRAIKGFYRILKPKGIFVGAIPINCKHKLDADSEAKEVYFFNDCKTLISSEFEEIQWFFNDMKTNCIREASESFLEKLRTQCGDFILIAKK
jgi:ubiquinone/menaquinone biosynthesis C-methylase UbiE